jgi:hypothetical protein
MLGYADAVRREVEQVGSGSLRVEWLTGMGLLLALGDPDRAEAPLAEAVDLATRAGFEDHLATAEFLLGLVWFKQGRLGRSVVALRHGLSSHRDLGNRRGVCNVLSLVVGVALLGGSTEVAAQLLGGLHRARAEFGLAQHGDEAAAERGFEALILERLGAEGRTLLDARPDSEITIDLALDTLDALAEELDFE